MSVAGVEEENTAIYIFLTTIDIEMILGDL